jgi:hypothetical protein
MTTRNFRVKNGLSVGDIVISSSTNKITGLSTAEPDADGDMITKGYLDTRVSGNVSSNALTQLNTTATVTDTGTDGAFTVAADGGNVLVQTAANTTITASADITLAAGADVNIPVNVGLAFGDGGEHIETDNTNLTITSGGDLNISATTVAVTGGLTVTGDLTVNGTTTTVNTTNLDVSDNIIELNSGISQSLNDAGFIIERGSTGNNAAFIWDESEDEFKLGTTTAVAGDKSGGITVTEGTLRCTVTAAQYSDVAERFASDGMYEPGTVVALGGAAEITAVAEEASDEVFGVVSGTHQAAFKMNGGAGTDETHPYIAMTGRVDVKVMGPVSKGDRLISSSVAGYARAATKVECTAFNVIGRALNSKQSQGAGSVLAAVRVSH